jgi:hypothetical protein
MGIERVQLYNKFHPTIIRSLEYYLEKLSFVNEEIKSNLNLILKKDLIQQIKEVTIALDEFNSIEWNREFPYETIHQITDAFKNNAIINTSLTCYKLDLEKSIKYTKERLGVELSFENVGKELGILKEIQKEIEDLRFE